ncbi:Leucine-rich repeat (LRR) family protein, putative [Theobroma cacao]|uniref:Leucine-rich repeat (LRR) family protein, putative n=1 Tax=Theobroma cacao TaxID=3641 RepID=A0A061ER99_THECC|nr:Leucine-rich repeat (LRR) family protein, putative [Theobroma cacao]
MHLLNDPDDITIYTLFPAAKVYQLREIETIDLSKNLLSGQIPDRLSALRRSAVLRLSNNGFSGRIPNINGLWQLQTLELDSNMFFGNLPMLPKRFRTLTLCHSLLSGHITSLGTLEQLRSVDVSDNRFSGSISKGVLALPPLNHINVSFNQLTVTEVDNTYEIGSPLQVLDAQENHLQGHLPLNMVTYESLAVINLAHNRFPSGIPMEYGDRLGNPWRALFLDQNLLSGRLPLQFDSGAARIKGSLANNCLRYPVNIPLCCRGQRPASGCVGENDGN